MDAPEFWRKIVGIPTAPGVSIDGRCGLYMRSGVAVHSWRDFYYRCLMLISLISAMTPDHVIGWKGQLPWNVPEDLQHFKRLTTGHTVLMGRKTFDSIRRPLPRRRNLILSRRIPSPIPTDTQWFTQLQEALAAAKNSGEQELFVVGGAEIYALAMPLAERMYISIIKCETQVTGDIWFPKWNEEEWRIAERRESHGVYFLTYYRILNTSPHRRILPAHEPGV